MFTFKALLEDHFEELARLVTTEHGKTLDESRGSVRRGIECVEVACGAPSLLMGYGLENVAAGIDCTVMRQPIGVCAAIAPFNFPAMVPLWFLPFAVVCGNTFVLKPSEQVPLSQQRMFELLEQCDLPPGVVNLVNGGREVVEAICDHPGIRAVSFVGSTPVARAVYQRATHAGKRVQALGGAKNFIIVMPDADLDRSDPDHRRIVLRLRRRALPGRQRARAGRRGARRGARSAHRRGRGDEGRRRARARRHDGAGDQREASRARAAATSSGACRKAHGWRSTAATTHVQDRPDGFFVGPSVFDQVSPTMAIGREEIFGPVASVCPVKDLDEAFQVMEAHPNANATSIFTSSGKDGARVQPSRDGVDGRRQHRRRGADGLLPVRRRARQLLRRPQGARPRRVRVLHGQEGHDLEVVLSAQAKAWAYVRAAATSDT